MSFVKYNKSDPEILAANARKGKPTSAEKEAALQARINAIVARASADKGPGYDPVLDYRLDRRFRGRKL
jgi:hypothetical protein